VDGTLLPMTMCRDKIRYRDRIAALMALASTRRSDSSRRAKTESRAYRCNHCNGWHLTSKLRRPKA